MFSMQDEFLVLLETSDCASLKVKLPFQSYCFFLREYSLHSPNLWFALSREFSNVAAGATGEQLTVSACLE